MSFRLVHVKMYVVMREISSTKLRQYLFRTLAEVAHSLPVLIHYKKGDSVIISYEQYQSLTKNKNQHKQAKQTKKLEPLVKGKICKPLGKEADQELLSYLNLP